MSSTLAENRDVDGIQCDSDDFHDISSAAKKPLDRTPLPKLQLFIVFLIQFAEPVTATVVYPFVIQFVRDTGITGGDERKTGYYAGIIESTFFLSETLTVVFWGWLSDRFGRKPVLLLGPLGLSIAMLGFGLSHDFWHLVYFRCFQGFFNGNIGVSKSVMAEITDETNIGDAFALIPLMWSTGVIIGPVIGGVLTRPAERWPDTLGKIRLLVDYPYFLPCLISALFAFASFAISAIALKETLPSTQGSKFIKKSLGRLFRRRTHSKDDSTANLLQNKNSTNYGSTTCSQNPEAAVEMTDENTITAPLSAMLTRPMVVTFANIGLLAFIDMAYAALLPLVYSTSIEYGGLGMEPYLIGIIMGIFGFVNALLSAFVLGPVIRKFGPRTVYVHGIAAFLITFSAYPIENYFARRAGGINWIVGTIIFFQFAAQSMILGCYASISILVVRNAPGKASLGSANGIAQMISSGSRSFAPFLVSSLFSISLEYQLAGGYLVYYLLISLALVAFRVSRLLPKDKQ